MYIAEWKCVCSTKIRKERSHREARQNNSVTMLLAANLVINIQAEYKVGFKPQHVSEVEPALLKVKERSLSNTTTVAFTM